MIEHAGKNLQVSLNGIINLVLFLLPVSSIFPGIGMNTSSIGQLSESLIMIQLVRGTEKDSI